MRELVLRGGFRPPTTVALLDRLGGVPPPNDGNFVLLVALGVPPPHDGVLLSASSGWGVLV